MKIAISKLHEKENVFIKPDLQNMDPFLVELRALLSFISFKLFTEADDER